MAAPLQSTLWILAVWTVLFLWADPGLCDSPVQTHMKPHQRHKRGIAIAEEKKYWTNGIVPYVFDSELTDKRKRAIFTAMAFYERHTCIRYVPWNSTTKALYGLANDGHLKFIEDGINCRSSLGNDYESNTDKGQPIVCCSVSPCIHELGHALGLKHEHFIEGANDWIRKNWYDKTSDDWKLQFSEVKNVPWKTAPYDASSPMHKTVDSEAYHFTLLFPELEIHKRYLYHLRFVSEIYKCQEHNCSSFAGQCHNEGFVTLVDGKCGCYCPPGLDPKTGCTTTRTKVEKMTFPGGSYAFLAPVQGCPEGFEVRTVSHKYPRSGTNSPVLPQDTFSSGQVTTRLCVHQSPYDNAAPWPQGKYCLYRVGGSCLDGFDYSNVTLETVAGGNWANFSDVDVGDNYVTFHYCCRTDNTGDFPMEMANTHPFILTVIQGCPDVEGMGLTKYYYYVRDPKVSNLHSTSGDTPFMIHSTSGSGTMYFYFCYYYPLTDNPFSPPKCVDSEENCPSLADSGQCQTSSQVVKDCPYSCDTCTGATNGTGSCIDTVTDCDPGLCPTYSESERTACSFTCRLCPEFCGGVINLTRSDPSSVITSPNFPDPYDSNLDCYWLVVGPADTTILLTFSTFDVESSGSECSEGDKLDINHARVGQSGLAYCGNAMPKTTRSITNQMELRLMTNFQKQRNGFDATVTLALPEDHCFDQSVKGRDYRGNVTYTRDWKSCVPWNETKHCRHSAYAPHDLLDGLDGHFCRNPGNGLRPWCYTNTQCDRNYCDVCFLERLYDTETDCGSYRSDTNCSNTAEARHKCARTCADLLPPRVKPPAYTQVTCDPPTPPSDAASGYTLKESYTVGENVSFTCVNNASISRQTTCLTDGHWSSLGYVCGGCPEGWVFHDNNCFRKFQTLLTYDDARAHCQSLQAQVAEVRTEEDLRFLVTLIDDGRRQWIALRRDPELCFVWEDGTQPSWTKWHDDGEFDEDCTVLLPELYWVTEPCSSSREIFVCQRPAHTSSVCLDFLSDCAARIEKSPTLCADEPDFAKLLCPRSCYGDTCQDPCASSPCQNGGKCYVRGGEFLCVCSDNYQGAHCGNKTVTSDSCVDQICGCSVYRDQGGCTDDSLRHYVLALCPRTCGLCSGPISACADINTNCPTPTEGQCQQDTEYLLQCMKTCEHCVDGPDCVDHSESCGDWVDQGLCHWANVTQMCPHGCNLCFNPNCYDNRDYCASSKSRGSCDRKPEYMLPRCPYTCHQCAARYGCYNKPCKNNGTCSEVSSPGDFTCDCSDTYFTGPTCEQVSAIVQCPDGWLQEGDTCYKFFNTRETQDGAHEYCSSNMNGATLATVKSAFEQSIIVNVSLGRSIWLDAKRSSSDADFLWSDCSPLSYTNWLPGQPKADMCVVTKWNYDGRWKTESCAQTKKFVCKYTPSE